LRVHQLLTSDEFAEWFALLDDRAAEDVAATVEVIAQLGTETEAPGSSEWLTWYEHPSASSGIVELGFQRPSVSAILKCIDQWGVFNGYARRVIKHLESPEFVARLGQLESGHAAAVANAVARIRRATTSRRLALSEFQRKRPTLGIRPLTPKDSEALAYLGDVTEIRESYFAALGAAGFAVVDVAAHSPALREISLRSPAPGLRLLYGVDVRRSRSLVVLGEWLDRSFYGDSVRRAEHLWRQFLDGDLQVQPARSR
jgi:hypothetical protein